MPILFGAILGLGAAFAISKVFESRTTDDGISTTTLVVGAFGGASLVISLLILGRRK